jgi:hypothetical protein
METMKKDMPGFYSNHWIDKRHKIAKLCGLENDSDLKILSSWIASSKWVLELGHGDGRVLDYITTNHSKCNIVTVENCKVLANFAREKYDSKKVHLIHGDMRDYKLCMPQKKFRLILMLWGLVTSFSASEIETIFDLYSNSLINNGFFVVDLPIDQSHFEEVDNLVKAHGSDDMQLNIYTVIDIKSIAEDCNLSVKYQIHYCGRVLLFISR